MSEKMQRSVVFIKPHVFLEQNGERKAKEIFETLDRLLAKSNHVKILAERKFRFTEELSDLHYRAHVGKPFYPQLKTAITAGEVWARVYEGPEIIDRIRKAVGATDPAKAKEGTIRWKFGDHSNMTNNAIHASGNEEDALYELKLHFQGLQ